MTRQCSVDGCNKHLARGLCSMHYARWSKNGDVGPPHKTRGARGEYLAEPRAIRRAFTYTPAVVAIQVSIYMLLVWGVLAVGTTP